MATGELEWASIERQIRAALSRPWSLADEPKRAPVSDSEIADAVQEGLTAALEQWDPGHPSGASRATFAVYAAKRWAASNERRAHHAVAPEGDRGSSEPMDDGHRLDDGVDELTGLEIELCEALHALSPHLLVAGDGLGHSIDPLGNLACLVEQVPALRSDSDALGAIVRAAVATGDASAASRILRDAIERRRVDAAGAAAEWRLVLLRYIGEIRRLLFDVYREGEQAKRRGEEDALGGGPVAVARYALKTLETSAPSGRLVPRPDAEHELAAFVTRVMSTGDGEWIESDDATRPRLDGPAPKWERALGQVQSDVNPWPLRRMHVGEAVARRALSLAGISGELTNDLTDADRAAKHKMKQKLVLWLRRRADAKAG